MSQKSDEAASARSVAVFCGASSGRAPVYSAAARELGQELAARGLRLVYGGASVGLMGAVANAALASGGVVVGVLPRGLEAKEIAHRALSELHIVGTMHERKALMADLADAFIALPGGFGTLDELFEIVTWLQLGLHDKPIGLLDVGGYYASLLLFLQHAAGEGFIRHEHLSRIAVASSPSALLDQLKLTGPTKPVPPRVQFE